MSTKRSFFPGEEWIYFKLYCSPRTSDKVVAKGILPLVTHLKEKELIKQWFFIRYRDPKYHLRLRFELNKKASLDQVCKSLLSHLEYFIHNRFIHTVQIDTYVRELERYGPETIELCESLFGLDSEIIAHVTSLKLEDEDLLHFALDHIQHYLNSFLPSHDEKLEFVKKHRDLFFKEFGITGKRKSAFRKKYDQNKSNLHKKVFNNTQYSALIRMFKEIRSEMNRTALNISTLQKHETFVLDSILPGLIHMSINRLYRDEQRLFETLCYDFLARKLRLHG